MVEFVHDEGKVNPLHAGMVTPSLSQTMCAMISIESHVLANGFDKFPGLAALDRLGEVVFLSVEENKVGRII